MFQNVQNTNKKAKAQPTTTAAVTMATTTQPPRVNEFIPGTSISKIWLMPASGIGTILFFIALKRGWFHRFFNLIGSILDRFRR
jgi:hypothetical protein